MNQLKRLNEAKVVSIVYFFFPSDIFLSFVPKTASLIALPLSISFLASPLYFIGIPCAAHIFSFDYGQDMQKVYFFV